MPKYRIKGSNQSTGSFEARKVTSENISEIAAWSDSQEIVEHSALDSTVTYPALNVLTPHGMVRVHETDYVIKDDTGNFLVNRARSFEQTFEEVN